ncbi:MAG: hypothetical protein N3B15_02135 [Planctomycetota bacterium]|nr:hypothetical protein [Planctomycetota bacterium]
MELGCFDGKALHFLPHFPEIYVGFDANWEGGIDIAHQQWAHMPQFRFIKATTPEEMVLQDNEIFDVGICMETLEHIPPALVDGYLCKIARHLKGHFFVTVPNEKGVVFLAKRLAKKMMGHEVEPYTSAEVLHAVFGRMHKVARREHKGFDYAGMIQQIARYFSIERVNGIPSFGILPPSLCLGVGIVAKSRQ